jgi:hypothetical protein
MGSPMIGNSRVAPLRRSGMSIASLFVSSDSASVKQSGTVPSPVQQSGACRPCSPQDDDATRPQTPECVGAAQHVGWTHGAQEAAGRITSWADHRSTQYESLAGSHTEGFCSATSCSERRNPTTEVCYRLGPFGR